MKNTIRVITLALVCLLAAGALTACSSNTMLKIPDEYKKAVIINLFEDTWSTKEDGSDKTGSVEFAKGSDEYNEILSYIEGRPLKSAENSGNFTADFKLTYVVKSYDFVFTGSGDASLIMRDPDGNCKTVDMSMSKYNELRSYIEELRLGEARQTDDDDDDEPIAGGYSQDRDVTEDDLAVFAEALEGYAGMAFTPLKVATQAVAGMNYRFTCTAKAVVPDAEESTKTVLIFKPLGGAPAILVDIVDFAE